MVGQGMDHGFHQNADFRTRRIGYEGLNGDGQADARVHGGVDRAVCVYSGEHYSPWRETLQLPQLPFGAFGENFTTTGLLESEVCIGDIYSIGDALVQVSHWVGDLGI